MGPVQAKKKTGKRGTSPLAVFLIALAIAALSLGGWIAWSYWGSNVLAQRAAADELVGLRNAIAEATPTVIETDEAPQVARPATGTAAWIVRIPAIGLEAPVIAGVEPSDLNRGLGARFMKGYILRREVAAYIEARTARWSPRTLLDHQRLTAPGGKPKTRGRKKGEGDTTQPGILLALLSGPLAKIDAPAVRNFLKDEADRKSVV